jgi:hypothetical protein
LIEKEPDPDPDIIMDQDPGKTYGSRILRIRNTTAYKNDVKAGKTDIQEKVSHSGRKQQLTAHTTELKNCVSHRRVELCHRKVDTKQILA